MRIRTQYSSQKGNIGIITAIIIVAVLFLWQIYKPALLTNTAGSKKTSAVIRATCTPDTDPNPPMVHTYDYETCSGNGKCVNVLNSQIDYVRIKKNVPITQHAFNGYHCDDQPVNNGCPNNNDKHFVEKGTISVSGRSYALYYPNGDQGNVSYDFLGSNGRETQIRMADYKLLYLVHLVPGQNAGEYTRDKEYMHIAGYDPVNPAWYKRYWVTDVYASKQIVESGQLPKDILECREKVLSYSGPTSTPMPRPATYGSLVVPSQAVSQNKKQLQLQYGIAEVEPVPDRAFDQAWWTPHCKPVVYLYPEKKETVSVKLNPKGILTETIPQYPKEGWVVTAYPDGRIVSDEKTYDYLYYESKILDSETKIPQQGFVKTPDELNGFFAQILPQLGLHQKESKAFSDYWKKALPKSPYYFIGIMDRQSIDRIEPLAITPNPDTIIRVRFYFKPLDLPIAVNAPVLEFPSKRTGFSVVEWGGMVKRDQNHPFTCSE